jgi:predicted outer membrane repeat protein
VAGWLKADPQPFGAAIGPNVSRVETFTSDNAEPVYYIVYLKPSGFVIVPADDLVEPIVGFADDGNYDPSPDNPLGALVTRDISGRLALVRNTPQLQAPPVGQKALDSQAKWQRLVSLGETSGGLGVLAGGLPFISDVRVAPLVQTKWAQTTCCSDPNLACYNYYTPPFAPNDPNNYPCGCVATAMAQVMRFHQYPAAGIGVHGYWIKVNSVNQFVITRGGDGAGGPYNWDLMVLEPDCNTTPQQRQAIGALCYDAGISVNMDYNPAPFGSRAFLSDVNDPLLNLFLYSNAAFGHNAWNDIGPPLIDMINPNLDYGRPAILGLFPGSTDGHAVVVDGYGYYNAPIIPPAPPVMYHHLNMGWAGVQDAWYNFCNDMPPGYTIVNGSVYNIFVSGTGEIISGRVTDASGNPLSGATVTAERTAGGTYNAPTNDKGIYALAKIPSASTYTVSVTAEGCDFTDRVVSTGVSGVGIPPNISGNVWGIDFIPFGANAIFVDACAPGKNDGSNWTNAYRYLQDALAAASAGNIILVAEATYKPDADTANPASTANRNATFQLISGVALYGGFPSGGCNSWSGRDPNAHQTILSGDIGTVGTNSDNSYHVVTGSAADATAILDGFVITAGRAYGTAGADKTGAGMQNDNGCPTVSNCVFTGNAATYNGGGMANLYCSPSPTVTNCLFTANTAGMYGGGMFNGGTSPTVSYCIFTGNSANDGGGAMANYEASNTIAGNCTFTGNSAHYYGGAIYNWNWLSSSIPRLINCTFSGNHTTARGGGAMANREAAAALVTSCTFTQNSAPLSDGGGIYNEKCSPILANCVLWANTDAGGMDESAQIYGGTPPVNYCCVQGWTGGLGGTGNMGHDPSLQEPNGPDGSIGTPDDNLRLSPDSPCIDAGGNIWVPADFPDLDGDGNTVEPLPFDLDGRPRIIDGDCDDTNTVDMGAYEFAWASVGDFDDDCDVDFPDFAVLALAWLSADGQPRYNPLCDISIPPDAHINWRDLDVFTDNWLAEK